MDVAILDYEPIEDTYKIGQFTAVIEELAGLKIAKCAVFKKDKHIWVAFPKYSREEYGNKKWHSLIDFRDEKIKADILKSIHEAVKKYYELS